MSDIRNVLVEELRNSAPSRRLMHTAADVIETLINYEALYQELTDQAQKLARRLLTQFPAWIPVTDRLPEDHDWVLVWHTGYKTPKKALFHVAECFEFDGGGAWYLDGYSSLEGTVTHWMPLPDPPEEVEA